MPVALAVLLAALVGAGLVWLTSRQPAGPDPVDPERKERWLVRWLGSHPRFGHVARSLDRRVAGGLALVVGLAITFVTALVVGLVFDMVGNGSGLARWDRSVAEWGSTHATDWSTDLLSSLTNLGGTGYLVIVAVAVAAYDLARWRNWNVPVFLLVTIGGVALLNNCVKWIVERDRPDVTHLVGSAGSSFPSGHSAAAAAAWSAFALVISRHRHRRGRAIAAGAAALIAMSVAASRALLGVHWLTDVIAGLAMGWGWFLLCALAFGGRLQLLGEPVERVVERQSDASAATVSTG